MLKTLYDFLKRVYFDLSTFFIEKEYLLHIPTHFVLLSMVTDANTYLNSSSSKSPCNRQFFFSPILSEFIIKGDDYAIFKIKKKKKKK